MLRCQPDHERPAQCALGANASAVHVDIDVGTILYFALDEYLFDSLFPVGFQINSVPIL